MDNGILGAECYYLRMSMFDYYEVLIKPAFAPPAITFGIVWPILYILMAVSFVMVALRPNSNNKVYALTLFVVQLVVNLSWTRIFFIERNLEGAFWVCVILTVLVIIMTALFFKQSFWAGILQIPYCLWLVFACVLSYSIKTINS